MSDEYEVMERDIAIVGMAARVPGASTERPPPVTRRVPLSRSRNSGPTGAVTTSMAAGSTSSSSASSCATVVWMPWPPSAKGSCRVMRPSGAIRR